MCGIWALLNMFPLQQQEYANMFQDFLQLKHRGPDHSSFEIYKNVAIGFHRLAIVDDRITANQPFVREDSQRTVVFICNGEIYNYKDLASQYNVPSYIKNDCEVLFEVYMGLAEPEHDFYNVVKNKVKGEFAFMIFEFDSLKNLKKLIVGRDEIGVRPLYYHPYTVRSTVLSFVSELKSAVHQLYNMEEFPPGHLQTYSFDDLGKVTIDDSDFSTVYASHMYFDGDMTYFNKSLPSPEEKTTDALLDIVQKSVIRSVRRRLSGDKPFAFLLSGGIDSSLVAALSAKMLGKPIRTFCCGMREGTDLQFARRVAQHIGSQHTEVFFTPEEGLAAIPDVIRTVESWDTTTIRASVGQYIVSKYIGTQTDCKVVMVGEGPDEVCSSYLFNWYAPNGVALDTAAKEYVKNIHYYDVKRADRCISRWGLEGRVPLLDPEFIKAYWTIPADMRMPTYDNMEKWWLRQAFAETGTVRQAFAETGTVNNAGILPVDVLWRKKEAFSDGVSGDKSWFQIIQEWVEDKVQDEELANASTVYPYCTPQTKEAYYYRKVFCGYFGEHRQTVIPGYWQPKWSVDKKEITDYVDPSARCLELYS